MRPHIIDIHFPLVYHIFPTFAPSFCLLSIDQTGTHCGRTIPIPHPLPSLLMVVDGQADIGWAENGGDPWPHSHSHYLYIAFTCIDPFIDPHCYSPIQVICGEQAQWWWRPCLVPLLLFIVIPPICVLLLGLPLTLPHIVPFPFVWVGTDPGVFWEALFPLSPDLSPGRWQAEWWSGGVGQVTSTLFCTFVVVVTFYLLSLICICWSIVVLSCGERNVVTVDLSRFLRLPHLHFAIILFTFPPRWRLHLPYISTHAFHVTHSFRQTDGMVVVVVFVGYRSFSPHLLRLHIHSTQPITRPLRRTFHSWYIYICSPMNICKQIYVVPLFHCDPLRSLPSFDRSLHCPLPIPYIGIYPHIYILLYVCWEASRSWWT